MAINLKAKETLQNVGDYKGNYRYVLGTEIYNRLSEQKVIQEAALRSGMSRGVMQAAWDAAGDVIRAWATEGHSVAIPGLGTMRLGVRAKSVATVNEVATGIITSRRVIFTPSTQIKRELADTSINITCTPNPQRNDSVPTLAQMTDKAIELLSKNEKGFFLQVEGASIDKQDHAANPCGQIGETVDLDEAVQRALEFAKKDGNTLVIVTADHAHASQIVAPDTKAPGLTQALNTKDGAVMVMSYGNSEEDSQEHTGSQLRIAAYGPHAANVVGLTDQTDLFYTMKAALGLK